jgi:GNAT superfamily N-acetyltransferase
MRTARRAVSGDLGSLLELYLHLNPDTPKLTDAIASAIWADMLSRPGVKVFVCSRGARLISTCTLITAPNLMRGGSPVGLIENVVTHEDFRQQGYGRAVMSAALDAAWAEGCHNVMLLTGRTDPAVHRFYAGCGFEAGKTGLWARRPDDRPQQTLRG